jgi:osmotically-inducible protein OsmY
VRSQADIDRAVQVARGIEGAKSVKRDDPVAERIHGRAIW